LLRADELAGSGLRGLRPDGRGGLLALCPCHDDHDPSLHLWSDENGELAFACLANCAWSRVRTTLLDMGVPLDRATGEGKKITAIYDYRDESGILLYQVVRYAPKGFRQRRPDGADGWIWNLKGTRRVLLRLPELIEAARSGKTIYATEGEKDALAIVDAGGEATCNPGGAGKWRPEYSEMLRGADVLVVEDKDEPGRKHAHQVAASLEGIAASVRIVEAAAGKDAADHLAAGKSLDEFVLVERGDGQHPDEAKDSARPAQIFFCAPELRDYVSPQIDWVIEKLLAKGVFTIFGGKPKAGKTTFLFGAAYAIVMQQVFMGLATQRVPLLYITEQNKTTIRPKLDEYGLLDCLDLHLMFPRQLLGLEWAEIVDRAATYCEQHGIGAVIVDTVNDLCHLDNTFSDTEWLGALDPLQRLAQHGDRAVLASLHAKKEDATLVDFFRGSNAIVGKADIVLGLWREGSGTQATRTIEGMSRLDNGFDERTCIVREGRNYLTAGTVKEHELEARLAEYLAALPDCREAALTRQEIAARLDVALGTVSAYLGKLMEAGKVLSDTRPGRGNARLYWAPGGDS
jgi:putative DNA primase/helicase